MKEIHFQSEPLDKEQLDFVLNVIEDALVAQEIKFDSGFSMTTNRRDWYFYHANTL